MAFTFSSPLIRGFTHLNYSAGTTATTLLDTPVTPTRRVMVIIQNKSTTASVEIILADTGSSGIYVPPLGNISIENYNGHIRAIASAAATPIHIAVAVV